MPRGGARKGAGRKKGAGDYRHALKRAAVEEYVRLARPHLAAVIAAQVELATGIRVRDAEGHVYTQAPSAQAQRDFLDRICGKPATTLETPGAAGPTRVIYEFPPGHGDGEDD
jgi:hypothetical protein